MGGFGGGSGNGIKALILQCISPHLICQTDAASFLAHIEHNALSLRLNTAQSHCKLIAAVTTHRAQCISGKTL